MKHLAGIILVGLAVVGGAGRASAASFSVVNSCSYTVYPGIYPPVYQNGGWSMAPGSSVVITVPNNFNGRVWGRKGCDGSSPARCATGQCGGTGLQCAGTTGQAGTSLAEFNLNAAGTDWYNVSYVDGFDNPIGLSVLNGSCVSPSTCSTAPLTNCSADLRAGEYCLSPCTRYNTDQFCCRGAFGTPQTCNVSQWSASAQSYVNNIHSACPREYAYAYDDTVGLHTCPTGASYTITFCPGGGGGGRWRRRRWRRNLDDRLVQPRQPGQRQVRRRQRLGNDQRRDGDPVAVRQPAVQPGVPVPAHRQRVTTGSWCARRRGSAWT